jgi:proliferating cell nuclear antigen
MEISQSPNFHEGDVMVLKTVQISPFRNLVTALKDIFIDANIEFTEEGLTLCSIDKSHTIVGHLFLDSEKFEVYNCLRKKIVIGVTLLNLHKVINTIGPNDTLTIYITNDDYNDGIVSHLTIKFENSNINQVKIQRLRLIEPDPDEEKFPDVMYASVITLPSPDFQKIIRDLTTLSNRLSIRSVGSELIFKCSGQFVDAQIIRSEFVDNNNMKFLTKPDSSMIMQGDYSLKSLGLFIKCTSLCSQIEMSLENDLPLMIKYNVASLGWIRLCLSQLPDIE